MDVIPARRITEAHRSGDEVFRLGDRYILKISKNIERLHREKTANDWLAKRLPVSESVVFAEENGRAYYLKTCVRGEPLLGEYLRDPERLARLLGEAMRLFHGTDAAGCPLRNPDSEGDTLVHGDFCLPNILAEGDGITGFIDTEAAGLGDPWVDYAWCIWSFEYNLGTDAYTPVLLRELGIAFDREKFQRYTAF